MFLYAVFNFDSFQIHYYNETYAVWEPLIERIEGGKKQWSLKLEVCKHTTNCVNTGFEQKAVF